LFFGAGLGSGWSISQANSTVLRINISNSIINARGSLYGAGIGSGHSSRSGNSTINILIISHSLINATGASASSALVGGSTTSRGTAPVGNVTLIDVNGTMNGGKVGLGSGRSGAEVESLIITGSCFLNCHSDYQGVPVTASSVLLSNASIVFDTQYNRLFGVEPRGIGRVEIAIVFVAPTPQGVESLSGSDGRFLQIGTLRSTSPETTTGPAEMSQRVSIRQR
jgi:hypothetical protein